STFFSYCNHIRLTNCGAQKLSKNGGEHLDTIPETKSDEFIKSSVENLIPIPSESEDLPDSECDVPACDDFTTFSNLLFDADDDFFSIDDDECDVPACDDFTTFSNLLFDADDDFFSIDDESFFDEDISKEIYSNPFFDEKIISIKIDPHHLNAKSNLIESLLNHDSTIISSSSKIDSLLDEFAEFISENSDAEIKSFSPSPIPVEDSNSFMEEIDLSFTLDDSMSSG
nr:hypothetical protein [Tanacetum cinerariifolium]